MAEKKTNSELLLEFFASWSISEEAMFAGFERFFRDDTEWENHGLSTIYGRQAAVEGQVHFQKLLGFTTVDVEVVSIAEDASGVVLCERIDRYPGSDGLDELIVMGITEFDDDGRITRWRDYFDSARVNEIVARAEASTASSAAAGQAPISATTSSPIT